MKDNIKKMPNNGGVDMTSFKNIVILPSADGGVTAQFEMNISSHAVHEIEDFVNSSLHSNEIFTITKQGIQANELYFWFEMPHVSATCFVLSWSAKSKITRTKY